MMAKRGQHRRRGAGGQKPALPVRCSPASGQDREAVGQGTCLSSAGTLTPRREATTPVALRVRSARHRHVPASRESVAVAAVHGARRLAVRKYAGENAPTPRPANQPPMPMVSNAAAPIGPTSALVNSSGWMMTFRSADDDLPNAHWRACGRTIKTATVDCYSNRSPACSPAHG
jgi:hypothetical protein